MRHIPELLKLKPNLVPTARCFDATYAWYLLGYDVLVGFYVKGTILMDVRRPDVRGCPAVRGDH